MKPVGKARGRGIFLFTRLNQISEWKKDHRWKVENPQVENYIVQRYIDNPYLVGGKKFDLRIYVLVLAYAPLKAYVYRSGFARFTIAHFSIKKEELVNNLVHLTNFSIQKHAPAYKSKTGTKWSVSIHSNKECDQTPHAPMSPLVC
jgi:tubulin polyglutamylase TTLL9